MPDNFCRNTDYFNPRSYKRSDSPSLFALSTIFHFNPRSYKRSDLYIIINIICCVISIHAPTRGATKTNTHHHQTQHYFNPRSYKRSDLGFCVQTIGVWNFNPRSYKRSDIVFTGSFNHQIYFNPRSYKRSDHCST